MASSPVALATVPSPSRALGRPRKTYTWAELVAGALGSDRVRLGAADPARSATGLLALAGIGASSARQGGDGDNGTPLLDYPYTLVNEARLSTAESRAAPRS